MRIRNKEIRRRRHRKEKVIKAAIKEAKMAGKTKSRKQPATAMPDQEPKPKKTTTKKTEEKAKKAKKAEKAEKKTPAKKSPAKRTTKKKAEDTPVEG